MSFDDLDNHMPVAGAIERAAVPMGFYLTWCASMQLTSALLAERAGSLLMRARFREARPTELVIAAAGGTLERALFNASGIAFTERYYGQYLADFATVFGPDIYAVRDDWDNYDRIARVLARRYFKPTPADHGDNSDDRAPARVQEERWWKFWS